MRHPTRCLYPIHESQPGPPGAYLHNRTRSWSSPLSISRPSICGLIKRSRPPLDPSTCLTQYDNRIINININNSHLIPILLRQPSISSSNPPMNPPRCLSPPLLPHPLVKSACVGSQRSVKMWRMAQSSDWQGLCGVTSPQLLATTRLFRALPWALCPSWL
jgi:hypothetical protein